jgi:hypothetical protein
MTQETELPVEPEADSGQLTDRERAIYMKATLDAQHGVIEGHALAGNLDRDDARWFQERLRTVLETGEPDVDLQHDLNTALRQHRAAGGASPAPAQSRPRPQKVISYGEACRRFNLPTGHKERITLEQFAAVRKHYNIR